MSDSDRFEIIRRQCRRVSQWLEEAENTADAAKAERLYLKARKQMYAVTTAVRSGLAHMDVPKAA